MKTIGFRWLVLLAIPGCLLVQPLDDVQEHAGSAGSSGKPSSAGSAGKPGGGSGPGAAGAGNNAGSGDTTHAGSGNAPPGGAANGGGSGGLDLSLFTGNWIITGGKNTVSCGGDTPTSETIAGGDRVPVGLGTISDLVFDRGTDCEILADVTADRTATLNPATLGCTSSDPDTGYDYDSVFLSFDFVVASDGKTAVSKMSAQVLVSDASGVLAACDSDTELQYKR